MSNRDKTTIKGWVGVFILLVIVAGIFWGGGELANARFE